MIEQTAPGFKFKLLHGEHCTPRRGELHTPHGIIETPCFWPVGTVGSVKLILPDDLNSTGAQGMLSNTYHLLLRPGDEALTQLGGLHRWGGWKKPILTDSGGFQVMSLATHRKLSEECVLFQSHIDGSKHILSPERSIAIQRAIGADIIFMLDVCPAFEASEKELREAHERTLLWAIRNRRAFAEFPSRYGHDQTLWAVVQGATDLALRREAAATLAEGNDFGYAIGGLAVGEPKELMYPAIAAVTETLPIAAPKHLLGVGTPDDLLSGIALGVDSFDCVLPTRNARHGIAFTSRGIIRIKNERYKLDQEPLDPDCKCACCRQISRSFLRHLYFASEATAARWLTYHNLSYYNQLLTEARDAIAASRFPEFAATKRVGWTENI